MAYPAGFRLLYPYPYCRRGSRERPEAIESLQRAVCRQFSDRAGKLYDLLTGRDTPLRGKLGTRQRARRSDGIRSIVAALSAMIDSMSVRNTAGRGYALHGALRWEGVAADLKMNPRTFERQIRDLEAAGLVTVVERKQGMVALKWLATKLIHLAGCLRAFFRNQADADAQADAAQRMMVAEALGRTRPGRKRAPAPERPAPHASPPQQSYPPLVDIPPDAPTDSPHDCMRRSRQALGMA